ncbi:hypothetical protein PUN28_003503 [Cardiocondyla obscurior]|uniref:Uncharacterized protein n=1 Tax=Cardiocondyla obscurior TaxID=286306 RepID=A0AAW2GJW8_9HYME
MVGDAESRVASDLCTEDLSSERRRRFWRNIGHQRSSFKMPNNSAAAHQPIDAAASTAVNARKDDSTRLRGGAGPGRASYIGGATFNHQQNSTLR